MSHAGHAAENHQLGVLMGSGAWGKLRYEVPWTLADLFATSGLSQIDFIEILLQHVTQAGSVGYPPGVCCCGGPLVPPAGIEPATHGLKVHCSAN